MADIKDASQAKERIIKKALTDPAFRKALLADANSAIEKELGAKLPAGVKVKVVEDSASQVHLVLHAAPGAIKRELSDADLERVSGGGSMDIKFTQRGTCLDSTNVPVAGCN